MLHLLQKDHTGALDLVELALEAGGTELTLSGEAGVTLALQV